MAQQLRTVPRYLAHQLRFLRLRGPLAEDPTAKILHALVVAVFVWSAVPAPLFILPLAAKPAIAAALTIVQIIASLIALVVLRWGKLRNAAIVYLSSVSVPVIILTLVGGITGPGLLLFVSIPISAAWLLDSRAVRVSSGLCLLAAATVAVCATMGVGIPLHSQGSPMGIWAVILQSAMIAALPVVLVLGKLRESLRAARNSIAELRSTQDELRRERDFFSRLMETSTVGIIALNREGRITFANSSAERIFGLTKDQLFLRTYNDPGWKTTTHGGDPCPDYDHPFRQVQTQRGALYDVRLAVVRPDGRRVLLSINAAPVLAAAGQFDGMVAALTDMTERVRVDGELQKHREHLEELVRLRTRELVAARDQAMAASHAESLLLANMSHELLTPLNAILGFSRILREANGVSPDHAAKLRIITSNGEHLLRLINDMLDIVRVEAGSLTVQNAPANLEDVVLGVADMMRIRAEEKNLKLFLERPPTFPQVVRIDAGKLRQILINLVSNAIKYTERGRVVLRLEAEPADERVLLKFEVTGAGVGIAPEDQERIFSPFVQLGRLASAGPGLGLAITRHYVRLMGGTISLESAPGEGSRFCVVLPVEIAAGLAPGSGRERVIGLVPGQPEYRVLVVEQQKESFLPLRQILTEAGFRVQAAEGALAAVEAFRAWRPHFIWMNWQLPAMGGREATRSIRSAEGGSDVKIAAVTAPMAAEECAAVLAAGVDDLVVEPFRSVEVLDCLARHLGVRYIYEKPSVRSEDAKVDMALTPEAVRLLPAALRDELAEALVALDVVRVRQLIRLASEVDAALGAALSRYAERIAFTPILKAIRAASAEPAGKEAS